MKNTDDALAPGTRLEQFVIERFLGLGGLGVTYLARDESLGVWRALKEYLPDVWGMRLADGTVGPRAEAYAEDYSWGLDRFLREARILARLESRHIRHVVRVYQVFPALGTAYMAMEYVEGRTLEAEVESEGPLSEERVRGLLGALTEGLSAVHAAGILHRDITPRNVMIRDDGTPVLIDFGSARQATGGRSGDVRQFLTPGFAPLEQYVTRTRRGSSAALKLRQGPWTDIYALGAVTYWAMSRPEHREKLDEAPARQVADELPPLFEAAGHGVSESLSVAVSRALAVHAEDRPQSLEEWRELLEGPAVPVRGRVWERALDGRQPEVEPPPLWRRWRVGAGAAVAATLLVVVALLVMQRGTIPKPQNLVVGVPPTTDSLATSESDPVVPPDVMPVSDPVEVLPDVEPEPEPALPSPAEVEEAQRQAELEAQRQAGLEAQRQAELEAQRQAELEAQRQAELEAQRQAELEAQRQAELEAQRQAELEAQRQAGLEAQRQAELEAQRQAGLEAQRQAELEAQRQAELEAQRQAELEEAEARRRAELEARPQPGDVLRDCEKCPENGSVGGGSLQNGVDRGSSRRTARP